MSRADTALPTAEEIEKIANRMETLIHSLAAIYTLSIDATEDYSYGENPYKVVAIKHMAKEAAEELEACCERMTGGQLGFTELLFGNI